MIRGRATLSLDEQAHKYRALDSWFTSPQGERVARAFTDELNIIREQCRGEVLLQLGSCGDNLWLPTLNFRYKWVASPCAIARKMSFISSMTALPIDRDSIDCVIAPLSVEAFTWDKNPIDEIDRVLKPMGHAIFLGINPFSFWGAALYWQRLTCFGYHQATLASALTLKRVMLQRGYQQWVLNSFYYIPPVSRPFLINNLEFLNEMGKMIWPFPAGFYCFVVQKYYPAPPSLLIEETDKALRIQRKSVQAVGKWMHD